MWQVKEVIKPSSESRQKWQNSTGFQIYFWVGINKVTVTVLVNLKRLLRLPLFGLFEISYWIFGIGNPYFGLLGLFGDSVRGVGQPKKE